MEATSSCCVSALPNSLASVTTSYAETALLAIEATTTRSSKVENKFCHSLLPNDEVLERFSTSIHQRDSDKLVDEVMCVVRRSMEQQASINNHTNNSSASSSNTTNNDNNNANYINDFHYTYNNSKCNSASEMWEQDSRCTHYAEDNLPLPVRLSRHIPQRDEMNMAISSFNLLQPTSTPVESFSAHHIKRTGPPFSSSASSSTSSLVYSTMRWQQKEQEQNDHHHHHYHHNHHHNQQQQHEQTNLPSRMSLSAPVSPSASMTGRFAKTNNINKLEMLSFTTSPLQSPEKTNQMEVQKCVNNNNDVTRNTTNPESSSSSSPPPPVSVTTQTNKNHHSSDKSILSLSHLASYRRQMNHNKRPKSVSLTAGFAGVCLSQPVMSSKQRRARDASHSSFTPPSSECASLVESFISDDSSHLTSLYNEMLVDHLNSSNTTSNTTKRNYSNSNGIEPNVSEVRSCQHEHNKRRVESCHSPSNNDNETHMPSRTIDDNETNNVLRVSTTTSTLTNNNGSKVNDLPLTRAHLDGMHLHSTITDQNNEECHCEEENYYNNTSGTSGRNHLKLQMYHGNETRYREKEEKVENEEEEEDGEDENDEDVNILSQHHRRRRKERCNGPNRVGGNVFAFSPNWDGLDDRYQTSSHENTLFKSLSLHIPSISSPTSFISSSSVASNMSSPLVNHDLNFANSFTSGTSKHFSSNKQDTCKLDASFSHSPTQSSRQMSTNTSNRCQHHHHQVTHSFVPRIHKVLHSTHKKSNTRPFYPNPECVLDAPEFPSHTSQLLHWGSNNKVVLGLKNVLYTWDAETRESNKLTELPLEDSIRFVQWIHKAQCIAVGGCKDGKTNIFDCRSQSLLRSVHLPEHVPLGQVAVNGPLLAISAHASANMPFIGVFDLRVKNALIASHSLAHNSAETSSYVSSLRYCHAEPFYLASGWSDGTVCIWDARRCNTPKYLYSHIHSGEVGAIHWNPSKRTRLFTGGGQDGVLCQINTHASFSEGRLSSDSNEEVNNILCNTMNSYTMNNNTNNVFTLNSPLPIPSLSYSSSIVSLPSSASMTSLGATQYVTVKNTPSAFDEIKNINNNNSAMNKNELEEEIDGKSDSHSNGVSANETTRSQRSLTTQHIQLYPSGSAHYYRNNNNNNMRQCHSCIVGAVNTMYPITGMTCSGDGQEILTSHRNKGQMQLRRANDFHLMCVYRSHKYDADITCISLAPDKERVCASQADESLKFWRVFAHDQTTSKSSSEEKTTMMTMMPKSKLHSQLDDKLR